MYLRLYCLNRCGRGQVLLFLLYYVNTLSRNKWIFTGHYHQWKCKDKDNQITHETPFVQLYLFFRFQLFQFKILFLQGSIVGLITLYLMLKIVLVLFEL